MWREAPGVVECDALPGVSVDVARLLRGLGPTLMVTAVKLAVAADGEGGSAGAAAADASASSKVALRSRGLVVDVPQLLRSLERRQLLAVVRSVVDPWPEAKMQLVQELLHLVRGGSSSSSAAGAAASGGSAGSPASSAGGGPAGGEGDGEPSVAASPRPCSAEAMESSASVARLPQLTTPGASGAPGKPRRPAGSDSATGALGRRSAATGAAALVNSASLPNLRSQATSAAADDDSGERLRAAVRRKDLAAVQTLIASRASVDAPGTDGLRPLALAMLQGTPPGILEALLLARASPHTRDFGQGRALAHLWAWTLTKSRAGTREAQRKLALLVACRADLDARMPATGDTPLHVLARVFTSVSARATDGTQGQACEELGSTLDAEKFARATQQRIQQLLASRADLSARNGAGKRPLDLVDRRFWPALSQNALKSLSTVATVPSGRASRVAKGRRGSGRDALGFGLPTLACIEEDDDTLE
eukprot:TRINITY_DN5556_c0_g1_i1.p1 TRINITY_DN5556_c0_g1~~TRINITY_DN5556_c0_g1_i1.p1  ORF type:complete len:479 (+),score=133.89 TRINITY_DN5556_c0_g1_i1:264-1700(+)